MDTTRMKMFRHTKDGTFKYEEQKITYWYELNICPKCGKKVTTAKLCSPPIYICSCLTKEDRERNNI